jgi:hypothetical protein
MENKQIDLQDAVVAIVFTAVIFLNLGALALYLVAKAEGLF